MTDHFEVEGDLHKEKLREFGRILKEKLPPSMGYTLLIFDYSIDKKDGTTDNGATFYLSTAPRDQGIKLLEEFLAKQKNTP